MNINEAYPSKYISSEDLQGREVQLIMHRVEIEEVGRDRDKKPVLYFTKAKKGMVLNKVNSKMIAAAYGSDTDQWEDRPVIIFSMKVQFGDEIVDGIRVRIPQATPAPARQAPAQRPVTTRANVTTGPAEPPPFDDPIGIEDTF